MGMIEFDRVDNVPVVKSRLVARGVTQVCLFYLSIFLSIPQGFVTKFHNDIREYR